MFGSEWLRGEVAPRPLPTTFPAADAHGRGVAPYPIAREAFRPDARLIGPPVRREAAPGEARNSLNSYKSSQNNTCLFETARGFKLDIPSIGVHPSVLEQSSEVLRVLALVLRPLLFELGLLFYK